MVNRLVLAGLSWLLACGLACADPGQRFISVAFHDVVDTAAELDADAVTSDRLVTFFDYLRGDGWTAITLDDIARARRGERALPDKAILVTFDDGYKSLYTRVFPLLLAYRIPVVAALVGEWVDAPGDATVRYSGKPVPRARFISWDQAREMQASGLVEFASHSYAQHRELAANPQGNATPALTTAVYDLDARRYEGPEQYRDRLRTDIGRNQALLSRELGRAPRAIVWPYGRYSHEALEVVREQGLEFALTLDDQPAHTGRPLEIGRYLPTGNLALADLVTDLRFRDRLPATRRIVRLDPEALWSDNAVEFDRRLGLAIERLRTLGTTHVILEALHFDAGSGRASAWFPSARLPTRADALNRISWQLRTRAGVSPIVDTRLARLAGQLDDASVVQVHAELGRLVPVDGLFLEAPGWAAPAPPTAQTLDSPAAIREARRASDASRLQGLAHLSFESFRAIERFRPELTLVTLERVAPGAPPSPFADLQMHAVKADLGSVREWGRALRQSGLLETRASRRRLGAWIEPDAAPEANTLVPLVRALQVSGSASIGWAADLMLENRPDADLVAPTVSGATFPARF